MMNDYVNEINKHSRERQDVYADVSFSIFTTILCHQGDGIPHELI